jgi:hypothetical protein
MLQTIVSFEATLNNCFATSSFAQFSPRIHTPTTNDYIIIGTRKTTARKYFKSFRGENQPEITNKHNNKSVIFYSLKKNKAENNSI